MRFTVIALSCLVGTAQAALAQQTRIVNDTVKHELTILIGPLELPPMDMSGGHAGETEMPGMVLPPIATVKIPVGIALYAFSYDAVDSTGKHVSSSVVHHINLIDPEHRELFLPISQRVLAVGRETGSQRLPSFLLGYPLAAGQSVVVSGMFDNPGMATMKGITVRVHLEYVPAGRTFPLFSVYPWQMDVSFPAGDKDFDLPPGKTTKSYEASPAVAGRLMAIGGHTHAYAQRLALEDVTAGSVVWEVKPVLDKYGEVDRIPIGRLYRTGGTKIYPDHKYRVVVEYDNPTGKVIPLGGMGVVGGIFMPSAKSWPTVDTSDRLYALDREHYLREVHGNFAALEAAKAPSSAPPSPPTPVKRH
jgi:hypothetical protein